MSSPIRTASEFILTSFDFYWQGHGLRVAESGLGLIADYPWSAPYEELRLEAR
jgi:hypothetical protein